MQFAMTALSISALSLASCASRTCSPFRPPELPGATTTDAERRNSKMSSAASGMVSSTEIAVSPVIQGGMLAPVSTGLVTTKDDGSDTTSLEVQLEGLEPPAKLGPNLTTYVVWLRPSSGGNYQNVGPLRLCINRTGRLSTTAPYSEVEVLVTAEPQSSVVEPGDYVIGQTLASKP